MNKKLFILPLLLVLMACSNESPELPGVFSIAKNRQVQFSPGVLKYRASTDTWRFADSQLDFVGEGNSNIAPNYNGWIDLFGYGTSGYNDILPYQSSDNRNDYAPTGDNGISGTEYDWGIHCQIENGGPKGSWHLMDSENWYYLLGKRENAESLATIAIVDNMIGLMIFPDGWENTTNISVQLPDIIDAWSVVVKFDSIRYNVYSKKQWKKLEKTGAVFFAYMGNRLEKEYKFMHTSKTFYFPSYYWCGNSLYAGSSPWTLTLQPGKKKESAPGTYDGLSVTYGEMGQPSRGCYVRLVKDVPSK